MALEETSSSERYGSLGARALLAAIFIVSGFGKLAGPAGTAAYIASAGLPMPLLLAVLAGVAELGGGLLLLAGFGARYAALGLAAFLVPVTAIFHSPIGLSGMEAQMQVIQVLKNLAIMGGLLAVATRGARAFSLDRLVSNRRRHTGVLAATVALLAIGCATSDAASAREDELKRIVANIENFDDLDYNVFTGQKWAELHRSHSHDVIVHWPDGHTTNGIDKHIEDLEAMFVWAPDTRIKEHPVKVGQGDWTAVIGIMEGTFTEPMPIGDGKTIPPTGKAYKIRMATFSHWTKDGPMDEEYLFWDNQEFMKQIGLGK